MTLSIHTALQQFSATLEQSAVVHNFRALSDKVAANPEILRQLQELEARMPLNNIAVIRQNRSFYADVPLLGEYLEARIAVLELLQQVNDVLGNQIRINIAASLQPASCCG